MTERSTAPNPDPTPAQIAEARALAAAAPWVDVHAHPGRCFLRGLPDGHPLAVGLGGEQTTEALAEIRASGVSSVAFSTVADLLVLTVADRGLAAGRPFRPGEARADHERQMGALAELEGRQDVRLVRRAVDLDQAHHDQQVGVVVCCEGADFLEGRLGGLAEAHRRGVRSVTLVHYRVNELGDIQTEPEVHGGLTGFGSEVVDEMNRLGMLIDLAHATYRTTVDVVARSKAPVVISHSHLGSGGGSHPRLLTDDHARAVAATGGLIGAWPAGVALTDLPGYVDEIVRLVDLVGVDHVGIGTDMDANVAPVLTSYGQFHEVAARLLARGLHRDDVAAVMGGNYRRVFAAACG